MFIPSPPIFAELPFYLILSLLSGMSPVMEVRIIITLVFALGSAVAQNLPYNTPDGFSRLDQGFQLSPQESNIGLNPNSQNQYWGNKNINPDTNAFFQGQGNNWGSQLGGGSVTFWDQNLFGPTNNSVIIREA